MWWWRPRRAVAAPRPWGLREGWGGAGGTDGKGWVTGGASSVLSHLKVLPKSPKAPMERSLVENRMHHSHKSSETYMHAHATDTDVNTPVSRARHLHTAPLKVRWQPSDSVVSTPTQDGIKANIWNIYRWQHAEETTRIKSRLMPTLKVLTEFFSCVWSFWVWRGRTYKKKKKKKRKQTDVEGFFRARRWPSGKILVFFCCVAHHYLHMASSIITGQTHRSSSQNDVTQATKYSKTPDPGFILKSSSCRNCG